MRVKSIGERASGSACEETQFWQYPHCRSQPSIPKFSASAPGRTLEERLLFDRIAWDGVDVPVWRVQLSALIEPDFAHALEAGCNRTAMPAGQTTHAAFINNLEELRFLT